jgi:hypothetical protein
VSAALAIPAGSAEDALWCGSYNTPGTNLCTFPWYTYSPRANAILFGTTYRGTPAQFTYGQAPGEYAQTEACPGPLTQQLQQLGSLYYCSTTHSPTPPIR